MKAAAFALTMIAAVAAAFPSAAQVAGVWRVSGKVYSFAFTLNCTFRPEGGALSGVCVDASTNDPKIATGKAHPLTSGSIDGDAVRWTYQSSFLLAKFDVSYNGRLDGDRMSGTISVQGRQGAFIATRL